MKKIVKLDAALRREVKAAAKLRIFSRLPLCMAAVAVYFLPALLVGMMTSVPIDASLERMALMFGLNIACEILLLGAIMLGLQYFLADIARNRPSGLSVVFSPLASLHELLRGVRMMLCMMVRMTLWSVIPTAVYLGLVYVSLSWVDQLGDGSEELFAAVFAGLVALYLLLLLPIMGRMASYVIGYALLREDPEMGVWRATREGSRLLRGQRRAMLAFTLSFLPWWFAGFLTCGLFTVFGMAYFCVSLYILADRLRGVETPVFPQI